MSNISIVVLVGLLLVGGCVRKKIDKAQVVQAPVSVVLQDMIDECQRLHTSDFPDSGAISKADLEHRRKVFDLLARGEIERPLDLYYAALIIERVDPAACRECFLLAHHLALRAVELGYGPARALAAASLDRYLVQAGLPQKFGTQRYIDSLGMVSLCPVDSLTTDSVRALWGIPSLDDLNTEIDSLNSTVGQPE